MLCRNGAPQPGAPFLHGGDTSDTARTGLEREATSKETCVTELIY
jgi:hypothetical protein